MISNLSTLIERAKENPPKGVVVAAAEDVAVLGAIKKAVEEGVVYPILVGNKSEIEKVANSIQFDLSNIEIINNDDNDSLHSAEIAIEQIHKGKASILMKGNIATGTLLKAVLNKEKGLRKSKILSHVAFFESPYYHKLLCVTDVAMNISPSLEDKVHILNNAVEACHKIGIDRPKVAVVAAVETVNPKMKATIEAAELTEMNKNGVITGCVVDGPLAIDNAVSKDAAALKDITGEVAGDCDIILAPYIEAGNMFYKALNFLGGASVAAIIMGATVPIVLTSRADSTQSKFMSIALAASMK
ncbi:MAG: bifunctional enoyl-CoA hydratase/phosphate acetyltransferase [Proteiniphilum sp.]|nr:bifunctional enoyl-CoA hydratase/phosphate acetyltransferase [Proteiniphilum sp.]